MACMACAEKANDTFTVPDQYTELRRDGYGGRGCTRLVDSACA